MNVNFKVAKKNKSDETALWENTVSIFSGKSIRTPQFFQI